jgi:DNA polymerase
MAEIDVVRPAVIVCLGDLAAQALLGPHIRVRHDRGRVFATPLAAAVVVTLHPAALLHDLDADTPGVEMQRFIDDLRVAKRALRKPPMKRRPVRPAATHRHAG